MSRLPAVIGLILCKRLEVNTTSGLVSLVGVCHQLRYSQFPNSPEPFTLYVDLYGGAGEGTIQLVIQSLETERRLYRHRRWVAFPGIGEFVHWEMIVKRCTFPSPGRYLLELSFDGRFLADRVIEIQRGADHEHSPS
ncbi:MAG TPA: hypothetical protein VG099_00010 [Gemmataceae bacterium]|nr:hypothetical protein [Gemmataceae bacterium]